MTENRTSLFKKGLKIAEEKEQYEICAVLKKIIESIENEDVSIYCSVFIDLEGLKEIDFIPPDADIKEARLRLIEFFDLESIFDYHLVEPINKKYIEIIDSI